MWGLKIKMTDMEWRHFSCGFFEGSCNFSVKNLKVSNSAPSESLCSLINLLERGLPSKPTHFLFHKFEAEHQINLSAINYNQYMSLIGKNALKWGERILGDDKNKDYPARIFFDKLIDEHMPQYSFIKALILPECPVGWIVENIDSHAELSGAERVDFYLAEANLVIEVDGSSHNEKKQKIRDNIRDILLLKNKTQTIRVPTSAIKENAAQIIHIFKEIESALDKSKQLAAFKKFDASEKYKHENIYFDLIAIARFQRIIAAALETQQISLNSKQWNIELTTDHTSSLPWMQLAIEDFFCSLNAFGVIFEEKILQPEINIFRPNGLRDTKPDLKIDLSIFQRFDETCLNTDTIYIRNSFIENFQTNSDLHTFDSSCPAQGSKLGNQINLLKKSKEDALRQLLTQVFGHKKFNDGQLNIIKKHFTYSSTLGLLPTGGGKSICFQLSSLIRRGCSLVVCPITALVRDHVAELNGFGFKGRAEYISHEVKGADRDRVFAKFKKGQLRFLFLSPEQIQKKDFRQLIESMSSSNLLTSIVVDEVHCISEWGHDFRTSYLTLGNTIEKHAIGIPVLSLTATASMRVLKDITLELNVNEDAVCYHMESSRKELNFTVEKPADKRARLRSLIRDLHKNGDASIERPFLIFTPHVNHAFGCATLIDDVRNNLKGQMVAIFSGTEPSSANSPWNYEKEKKFLPELNWQTIDNSPQNEKYGKYKSEVQKFFKTNKLAGICATKSFGMGINKQNVRTTVHYGCPQSMESLYQEAGRAGRDKKAANCYVLFSAEKQLPDRIFAPQTDVTSLLKWQKSIKQVEKGDFSRQLFLMINDIKNIKDETALCSSLLSELRKNSAPIQQIGGLGKIGYEKNIYRLYQLGFVTDWTVEDFIRGIYEVHFLDQSPESLAERLKNFISKYSDSSEDSLKHQKALENIILAESSVNNKETALITYLLQWNYDHFVYNRRQSLKTVYEACDQFSAGDEMAFKAQLEGYFSVKVANRIENVIGAVTANAPAEVSALLIEQNGELKSVEAIVFMVSSISRYLETYQNNPGLNLLSAACRALLDDFDNADGRNRLNAYLNTALENQSLNQFWPPFRKLLMLLPTSARENICLELLEFDLDFEIQIDLYENLAVNIAGQKAIELMNQRLERIM